MEGSRGKEAGTRIGSNEDRSSRRKKGSYTGYLYSSLSSLNKRELFLCFQMLIFFFSGGGSVGMDRLILVIGYLGYCFFSLLGLATAGEGSCASDFGA